MNPGAPNWYKRLMQECPPRNHTEPDWECPVTLFRYQKFCVIADLLGIALMPWQRLVLSIIAMPGIFELVLVVGRQQGKTTVLLIPMLYVLLYAPKHTVIYSAQKGLDANKKVNDEFWPPMENAGLDETAGFVFNKGTTDFGVHGTNETHLRTMSSAKDSLRGATRVAFGVVDEARADKDSNRIVLLVPTMTVVSDAKLVVTSTAGHEGSLLLKEQLEEARNTHELLDSVVALCEWGVDTDFEYDPESEIVWRSVLPGIGYTVTVEAIRRSFSTMELHDFCMEYLGHWLTNVLDEAIPRDAWQAVASKSVEVTGELILSIDSPPEQDRTAAVVCDSYGQIELVDVRTGTVKTYNWVMDLLERRPEITRVALAKNNTLKRTGERLAIAGKEVKWYDTVGMHMAAARFWEAVYSDPRGVVIRHNPIMNDANNGAFRWNLSGGGWVFMRQTEEHFVSPLIAATMAYDTAIKPGEQVAPGQDDYDSIWNKALEQPSVWDHVKTNA